MDYLNETYSQTIVTEEETFRGLPPDRTPPLNFQILTEHEDIPRSTLLKHIDFSPLVKLTPFEKEKRNKLTTKMLSILPSDTPELEEVKIGGDSRVTFDDEAISPRIWGASRKQNRSHINPRTRSQSIGKKGSPNSPLRSILKKEAKSKYRFDFSTQNSSEFTRNFSTQNSGVSKSGPRMSIFQRFNEVARNEKVGGSGDVSMDPSFSPIVFSYNSDAALDYQPKRRSTSRSVPNKYVSNIKRKSAIG